MTNPKVSIIVPVYNAEKYIRRCLDSIIAQTMPDFELLLIDDGSPDNSGAICDEYAKKDSRVRVFHKDNGGVASARQMGIDNAHGEYSIHADPDDWVEPNMLEELYAKAKESDADMVIADFFYETKTGQLYYKQCPLEMSCDSIMKQLISGEIHGATWNKLVKTDLYKKYKIQFPLNMSCMEDTFVICSMLMHNIKVDYIPKAYYHYDIIINKYSLTAQVDGQPRKGAIDSMIYFIDYFEKALRPKEYYFSAFTETKMVVKLMMWSAGLYSRSFFVTKYKEINRIVWKKYKNGQMKGYKSYVYMLNGGIFTYYALYFLWLLRKKTGKMIFNYSK